MATILAHIKIHEGKEADFEKAAKGLYGPTHEVEDYCRRYEYWRAGERGLYYCLLSFDDYVGFMKHQVSDHHEAPDYGSFIENIRLEWLDPVQGASDLPPTNPQDLPADAGERMKQYAEMQPVEMQAWWGKVR
jgi:quinol monooxygenase YgiN